MPKRKAEVDNPVDIVVPMAQSLNGYAVHHVDVHLSQPQAEKFRRMFDGLNQGGLRLKNGRYVQSPADVVRYMIDNAAPA